MRWWGRRKVRGAAVLPRYLQLSVELLAVGDSGERGCLALVLLSYRAGLGLRCSLRAAGHVCVGGSA